MEKSSALKYSRTMRALHWLIALLLIALLIAGMVMVNSTDEATKFAIIQIHAPLGILAGLLLLVRIFFAFRHPRPAPDPNWSPMVKWGSKIVHILLYILPFALVSTGIGTMVLSGLGPMLQSGNFGPWPDMSIVPPAQGHSLFAKLFMVSLVLHIAGAIYHQWIVKDNLIARMMPGK